jgi:SAM-dependent methyltransferase
VSQLRQNFVPMPPIEARAGGAYTINYLKWKNWGEESFGLLTPFAETYFKSEVAKAKIASPKISVLEIGFGNGTFLAYAKKQGWEVAGTEVNENLVSLAKINGFDVVKTESLKPFSSDQFDLVVAFDVLEHVPPQILIEFLTEVRRVLKKGGVLLARFPNGDSPLGLPYQNGDITHLNAIGTGKVVYLANLLNFDVLFMGAEAQPILSGSLPHTLHRMFTLPIKAVLEFVTRMLFFPKSRITFFSSNLVIALRRK